MPEINEHFYLETQIQRLKDEFRERLDRLDERLDKLQKVVQDLARFRACEIFSLKKALDDVKGKLAEAEERHGD